MPEVVPSQTVLRVALAAMLIAACSTKGPTDAGGTTGAPDICNAQSDAQTNPACQLTLAAPPACFYLDHVGKDMWLGLTMPAGLTAQSLLTIEAGYSPSSGSPVELSMNVVSASQASLVTGENQHGQGSPSPITVTTTPPAALSGQQIFLIFSDVTNSHFDIRNQFCVTANVVTDPDVNVAGVPTTVTLTAGSGGVETNTPPNTGNLSTAGRVDEFSVVVDPSVQKPILYLSIVVPPNPDGGVLSPPINYLMGFNIYDCGPSGSASATTCAGNPPTVLPEGSVVATGHMPNVFIPVDLGTAIPVTSGDIYVVEVAGVNGNNSDKNTVPGDIRVTYDLTLAVMPDLDPYDGATPTAVNPSLGGAAVTLSSGRLSYTPQVDSFAITLPANANNTRIHYLITPGASGSRFPTPLPLNGPRITTLSVPVPASPGMDPGLACNSDQNSCPNDTGNLSPGPAVGLPEQFCELDGGPQCLYSYRQEDPGFKNLGNFEGIIPVKAGTTQVNLSYEWQGSSSEDDVPYTLSVTWLQEGPENQTPPYHWSEATAIDEGTIALAPASTTMAGSFTIGDSLTDNSVQTVRGQNDYDAVPSTLDVYQFEFPTVSSAALYGATWDFSFTNGTSVTFEFAPFYCTDQSGTPICGSPPGTDPFDNLESLFYNTSGGTWYGSMATVWSQSGNTYTVDPGGCFCFEPDYLSGGKFYLFIHGENRTSYANSPYTISTSIDTYPQSNGDGGLCPQTLLDADAGIAAKGCGMAPPRCGGSGDQCLANASCCSQSCNFSDPCPPTGGNMGMGQNCTPPGYGYCN